MTYSIKAIRERFQVGEHTVLGWIRNGDLKALNVGATLGKKKPRWRVTEKALEDFELRRTHHPPESPKRRRKRTDSVTEYY